MGITGKLKVIAYLPPFNVLKPKLENLGVPRDPFKFDSTRKIAERENLSNAFDFSI